MSTLLRDVLDIPEQAGAEDYVLRLTDSVEPGEIARTVDDYVVTPALAEAFDTALGLVAEALTSGVSRGAFLAGSFGSGKSHFMAVLHALLRHDPAARAKPELQPVIARHDDVLLDKNVLPLAFHLLGAESLEQALFGGYVRQVARRHPEAPLPAVHESDAILRDAERLRARDGDDRFLAGLNGGAAGARGGRRGRGCSAIPGPGRRSRTRRRGPPRRAREQRQQLVTALAEHYFSAYTQQAEFVDLDTGLAAIAAHAKEPRLRRGGAVPRRAGAVAGVLGAGQGVLPPGVAEADQAGRVRRWAAGRSRWSRSSPGRWTCGAGSPTRVRAAPSRRHWTGRSAIRRAGSATFVLGDDNLPYVANRRLLRAGPTTRRPTRCSRTRSPGSTAARRSGTCCWTGSTPTTGTVGADEEAFRLTYPFSPALVSTLRSLASVMQRERTALKVMQQMLVDRRDTLTVDDVVPVGDSFDYVVQGRDALDPHAAALFRGATALYRDKLRPILLKASNLTEEDATADPERLPAGFRADDRLAKTLLLSAVAPRVPALKELTAARLASLNHGSIRSPLPGSEAGIVLTKVREWSRNVPEIHIGGDTRNPVIRVQLADVDYETVVEKAKGEDNEGRRRELLKDLVREAIGISERDPDMFGAYTHPVVWRGSRRSVDLVFGNVRDASWLTEDHFRNRPGTLAVRDRLPVRRGGALGGAGPGTDRPAGRGRAEGQDHRVAAPVPLRGPDARREAPGHPGLAAQRHRGALDHVRRSPVRGGPGPGQGDPGRPAHRTSGGVAPRGAGVLRRGRPVARHSGRG